MNPQSVMVDNSKFISPKRLGTSTRLDAKKENNDCNSCVDYCSDVYNTKSNNFDACIEGCYQNSKVDCKKYYQTFDDFKEFYMKHKVTDNNCKS